METTLNATADTPATPSCRTAVEDAMQEMIDSLCTKGFDHAEIALALADAAEDYVIFLASATKFSH